MFRDDTDALRARIEALEKELEDAHTRLRELEGAEAERARLATRVEELEAQLQKHDPRAKKKERARQEAEAQEKLRKLRAEHGRGPRRAWSMQQKALAAGIGVLVLAPLGWLFVAPQLELRPEPPPTIGLVDLGATPSPTPIQGVTRGTSSGGFGCSGYVPDAPQIVLRVRETQQVHIAPTSTSGDLVLVVVTPDGETLCDDDSGDGTNPVITTMLPPGDSRVFVGTYREGEQLSFSLGITAVDDDAVVDATGLAPTSPPTLGSESLARGETRQLSYTGDVRAAWADANRVQAGCRGYLPLAPHLVFTLEEEATLLLTANAREDLVMLVRSTSGLVRCDDDSGGSNWPRIATLLGPGEYAVWVGTFSEQHAGEIVPFTLTGHVGAVAAGSSTAGVRETLPGDGTTRTLTGTTLGEVTSRELGAPICGGLVPARAQLELSVDAPHDVSLDVRGASYAPPVVVRHPDGSFACFTGPSLATWQAGVHQLFVGVPDGASPEPFVVTVRAGPSSVQPYAPPR